MTDHRIVRSDDWPAEYAHTVLEAILGYAPVSIFITDANGIIRSSRGLLVERMGLAQDENVGRSMFDLYARRPALIEGLQLALNGTPTAVFVPGRISSETQLVPIRDPNGMVAGVVGVSIEVTEREQQLRQLHDEQARLNARLLAVLETAPDGIVIADERGTIESVNAEVERLFGFSASELVGKNVSILMPEPYQREHDGYIAHHTATGENRIIGIGREVRGQRKDGSVFAVDLSVGEAKLADGTALYSGLLRDAAERTAREQMLADQARLEAETDTLRQLAERERSARALAEASRAAAEHANLAKTQFLSNMSHELRTPLNAILGFTELVRERAGDRLLPRELSYLDHVREGGTHLLSLINDLLDLARVEAGRLDLHPETISLVRLVEPVVASIALQASGAGLRFSYEFPGDQDVLIDPGRVRQVLLNLLSNAVKFTPEGSVRLSIQCVGADLVMAVADTGIGIPADRQHRVFGTFERLHEDRSAVVPGSGIGLALTRQLVEAHGGTIEFDSTEGVGTTFHVRLPGVAEGRTTGARILIVEDDPRSADLIAAHVTAAGMESEIVGSVAEALRSIEHDIPTAVVTDLRLPLERGEQLIRTMQADPVWRTVPILVVSVEDTSFLTRELGADDQLTKPVDTNRLTAWLARQVPSFKERRDT